ncbi:MAG: hypothetical protein ACLUOF_01555 [Ruminococcus sp.]
MQRELKKRGIPRLKVVYSKELPVCCNDWKEDRKLCRAVRFGRVVAELILAGEVIKDQPVCGHFDGKGIAMLTPQEQERYRRISAGDHETGRGHLKTAVSRIGAGGLGGPAAIIWRQPAWGQLALPTETGWNRQLTAADPAPGLVWDRIRRIPPHGTPRAEFTM